MALDTPIPSTPTYCTADDVAAVLQRPSFSAAADEGEPTPSQVDAWILQEEDRIDRETRHAWRERKVTSEWLNLDGLPDGYGFIPVKLRHRSIRAPLSSVSGDSLNIRVGSTTQDFVTTQTQGLNGAFFVQEDQGILHVKRRFFPVEKDSAYITYRYGETAVPGAIKRACAIRVAAFLAIGDAVGTSGRGGTLDRLSLEAKREAWLREAAAILANFMEWT